MLNKYITGFGAIAVTAASASSIALVVQNNQESKIYFQGRMFASEDDVIDYMFETNFLRVEKENVIGDLQNSYSNYDLGTLHKGKLPTYDPTDTSFAWRMANGMLTDDLESAKETYFNEGISNILYSDGYGNDYLSQSDAVISAKQNITSMFNPYIELPDMENGLATGETSIYNPFNKSDVEALKANIDINELMNQIIHKEATVDQTGYNIHLDTEVTDSIEVDIPGSKQDEFLWHEIPDYIQDYSTNDRYIGTFAKTEQIDLWYKVHDSVEKWKTQYMVDSGDKGTWYNTGNSNTPTTHFHGSTYQWHKGTRVTSGVLSESFDSIVEELIVNPQDIFYVGITSDEISDDRTISFSSGSHSTMPTLTKFEDEDGDLLTTGLETIMEELITFNKDKEGMIREIFDKYKYLIEPTITSTIASLELSGSGNTSNAKEYVIDYYRDISWFENRIGISKFTDRKIYQTPQSYRIDFSNLPLWARNFMSSLSNDGSEVEEEEEKPVLLTYNNTPIFEITSTSSSGVNYELSPLQNAKNIMDSNINGLNDGDDVKNNLIVGYDNNNGQGNIDTLHNYYKRSRDLADDWGLEYELNVDEILYLDSYSSANQLLTSRGRFNPSFSSSTTPTSFITDEVEYDFQENSFVPTPVAKYVFYDLNGNKIEYSEDAYDSFELMKRNIMRNIYVPKSSEYVYVDNSGTSMLLKNEQNSIYKINIEGTDVYFAEHLKMRNYLKNILPNLVKYL